MPHDDDNDFFPTTSSAENDVTSTTSSSRSVLDDTTTIITVLDDVSKVMDLIQQGSVIVLHVAVVGILVDRNEVEGAVIMPCFFMLGFAPVTSCPDGTFCCTNCPTPAPPSVNPV